MSMPPTTEDSQQAGGLGRSTPLVTVSNVAPGHTVHSGIRTSTTERMTAVSAGMDHPLASVDLSERPQPRSTAASAAVSPPPPSIAAVSIAPMPTVVKLPPPAQPTISGTTPTPNAPILQTPTVVKLPLASASSSTSPNTTSGTVPAKKTSTSLDDMATEFLEQSSLRTVRGLPPLVKPPPLPKEEQGIQRLRTLVHRRAWGDVLQVCGDMLRGPTSPYTPIYASLVSSESVPDNNVVDPSTLKDEVIEILTLECHAWLSLRRFTELGREVDRWNFLTRNDSSAKSPSWIPWSLHILAAESLLYTDTTSGGRCTDELYGLRKILMEKKQTAWLPALNSALSNAFLKRHEWRLALAALDDVLEFMPDACRQSIQPQNSSTTEDILNDTEIKQVVDKLSCAFRCEVFSRQGRIMLQIGALLEASTLFEDASKEWQTATQVSFPSNWESHRILQHIPTQLRINDGLLCFSHGKYDVAMTHFRKAVDIERSFLQDASLGYQKEDWMGMMLLRADAHNVSLGYCANNLALCALYTRRMQDAVNLFENLVRQDPSAFLTERLAFNLCTLYELGNDAVSSSRKKRVLQVIAKRFYLHDIGPESFRVS